MQHRVYVHEHVAVQAVIKRPTVETHPTAQELKLQANPLMTSTSAKSPSPTPLTPPNSPVSDAYRTKSIATRLTETEFAEVESTAARAGQKISEWLRDAALSQARSGREEHTDPILLAEILGLRALVLNLFAQASEGPLSEDDLRKISEYAEAIKDRKAEEALARTRRNDDGIPEG